jgi:hypothetical protein
VLRFLRATASDELRHLDAAYAGVAFGAEFCACRLPALDEVRKASAFCATRQVAFTLVTPVVRQAAFADAARWLEAVAPLLAGGEWVANDWGLLEWARRAELPLRPVAGRLLGRQRRGPRVLDLLQGAHAADRSALRGSAWDDGEAAGLLAAFGIARVELDLLLQGVRVPDLPAGVQVSLCGPWLPVTLSPSCPWTADPIRCARPCRDHPAAVLRNEQNPVPLWSRGNALFVRWESLPAEEALDRLGADRLVWSPEIPG